MITPYIRRTPFPVSLEERLRHAYLTEYLMVRRCRRDAAITHARLVEAEVERLSAWSALIGESRHMFSRVANRPQPGCFVCGIPNEGHDAWIEGRAWPPGYVPTYAPEPRSYERHLEITERVERAMSDAALDAARHMRRVLREGEW